MQISQYGDWKIFYPEVDSGAPISVFNKDDCDVLGYSIRSGRPIYLSGVLGGDEVPAYIHIVDIKIGDETIPAKIAFTDGKKHKQLLIK